MRTPESNTENQDQNDFEKLFGLIKVYISNHLEGFKLEVIDQSSKVGAAFISNILIGVMALMFLFFGSLAAGFYISFLFNDNYSGFCILAVFYLILALIFKMYRKSLLDRPIQNKIIEKILEEQSTDETTNP